MDTSTEYAKHLQETEDSFWEAGRVGLQNWSMWEKVMTWEWAWKTLKGHGILRTVVLVYEVKNVWYEVGNTYRLRFPLGDLQDTMQLSTLLTF